MNQQAEFEADQAAIEAQRAGEDLPAPPAEVEGLRALAIRLTPNPARTVDGTLEVILDGIDRIDEIKLARALGYASARQQGLDVGPLSDAAWAAADPEIRRQLIYNAGAMKVALRLMKG